MKFSLWTNYGAQNSKPVFDAFARGAQSLGYDITYNNSDSDVDVIWSVLFYGRMAGNQAIWDRAMEKSKPVVVLEVGGIERGVTWKVGLNGINRDAYFGDPGTDESRPDKLGLKLKPWNTDGKYVLICGQHDKSLQWKDMPRMSNWVLNTISEVQSHCNNPIIFRPHPRCSLPYIEQEFNNVVRQTPAHIPGTYDDFDMSFDNIMFTISWSSNPGIHSILNGVPAYVGPSSLAYDVATKDIADIKNPSMPERQKWLVEYSHTEWTLNEIATGMPLKRLTNRLF